MSLIDLTNYSEHPTQPGWLVFRYPTAEHAREMMSQLNAAGIDAQADLIEGPPYMVGVRKSYSSRAERFNYIVLGKYRKPFVPNSILRWGIILFTLIILALAIGGLLAHRV